MALSLGLVKAGFTPERINTTATVHLDKGSDPYRITSIELDSEAQVPGINRHQFLEQVELAKTTCVVSEALRGTEIRLQARLDQAMR